VNPHDIWSILDRYGLPIVALLIVVLAIYKLVWPLLLRQMAIISTQLDIAQERLEKSQSEFMRALERRDAIMSQGFADLHTELRKPRDKGPRK